MLYNMYYAVRDVYEQMGFGYLTTNYDDRFVLGVGCEYVCKKSAANGDTFIKR